MREILFKAKRIDNGEWVEGYYSPHPHPFSGFLKDFIFAPYYDMEKECGYDNGYQIDRETLCQYTGLTDKNGNKIWENDLVKRCDSYGDDWCISKILFTYDAVESGWHIRDVKLLNEYARRYYDVSFSKIDAEKYEVIGNTFDNPEMMNTTETIGYAENEQI